MRLISPGVELGDQLEEVPAVLLEDVILLLNQILPLCEGSCRPRTNDSGKFGDRAEDVSDYFHNRRSFGVEETSEESSFEVFLMDSDKIVQAGNFVKEIVLKLKPGDF